MTRDEILGLEGLELRKAVAEARGYKVLQSGMYYFGRPSRHCLGETTPVSVLEPGYALYSPQGEKISPRCSNQPDDLWDWAPAYESDISEAWTLCGKPPLVVISGQSGLSYVTSSVRFADGQACVSMSDCVHGKTIPEAICRAYLLAKAVTE